MEQGPVERTIIEQCIRQRLPLPERIANAPELLPGLELFFTAFMELGSCRQLGMSVGPIPWTAVQRYCEVVEIDSEQREDLFFHIQQLDAVYLDWQSKQSTKK